MSDDRAQAVVPAGPTADLYADIARREIQVVVYNYELLNFEPGESHPRIVHIRRRLEKRDLLQAETYPGGLGLLLCAPEAAVAFRELVGDEESDVVAGGGLREGRGFLGPPKTAAAPPPPRRVPAPGRPCFW